MALKSKSILDRSFVYTPACSTNIRLTFARVRRQMKADSQVKASQAPAIIPIKRAKP